MSAIADPDDFDYELPAELIAQAPLPEREASRLLYAPVGAACQDLCFTDLPGLLQPGDLLVLNDTRVMPGRLLGRKSSGGAVEMLLERTLDARSALVQLRASRAPREGTRLLLEGGIEAEVLGREGNFFLLAFSSDLEAHLEKHGHVPLPPYIERADDAGDRERYQTVYARDKGAVAAPTAGLHFSESLLAELRRAGVGVASVTLHVGAGTFLPLRDEQLQSGRLHQERIRVDQAVCDSVTAARAAGGRVVAVGTTVMRTLEAAAATGELKPLQGETDLFIAPGYEFKVADLLITNFHLPKSSLMMLVSAFHGREEILRAYRHAVEQRYRFFSYGDAMLLEKNTLVAHRG